jgi:putative endonuclease
VGVTGRPLPQRVYEHRQGLVEGFTKRYNVEKLVYFEVYEDAYSAITREKQLKAGSRERKVQLIETNNPGWKDLYDTIV